MPPFKTKYFCGKWCAAMLNRIAKNRRAAAAEPSNDRPTEPCLRATTSGGMLQRQRHAEPSQRPTRGDMPESDQRSLAVISRPQSTTRDRPRSRAPTPEASGALPETDPRTLPQRLRHAEHFPRRTPKHYTRQTRGGLLAEHYPRHPPVALYLLNRKNAEERAFSVLLYLIMPAEPSLTHPR